MLVWPKPYARDPSWSLLKPLLEEDGGWLSHPDRLSSYLIGRQRTRGSQLAHDLEDLLAVANAVPSEEPRWQKVKLFLASSPLGGQELEALRVELTDFVDTLITLSPDDPWAFLPEDEPKADKKIDRRLAETLDDDHPRVEAFSEEQKKKLIGRKLKDLTWQEHLQMCSEKLEGRHSKKEAELLADAIKENGLNPAAIEEQKRNEIGAVFRPKPLNLEISLPKTQLIQVFEAPILLGSHYISARNQNIWLTNRGQEFHKLIGTYALWDNAKIALIRDYSEYPQLLAQAETELLSMGLRFHGPWVYAFNLGDVPSFCSLVVDRDVPSQEFPVFEWKFNVESIKFSVELYRRPQQVSSLL